MSFNRQFNLCQFNNSDIISLVVSQWRFGWIIDLCWGPSSKSFQFNKCQPIAQATSPGDYAPFEEAQKRASSLSAGECDQLAKQRDS